VYNNVFISMLTELSTVTLKGNETNSGERKLFADLFSDYVPEVRPRIDPTQNVSVTVDLDLNHIKHLVVFEPYLYTFSAKTVLLRNETLIYGN